jgi:hypothetical protein
VTTGALLPVNGNGYFTDNGSCTSGRPLQCSWRAGCGEIRKSGSEGSGEETTGRKAGIGAAALTLRDTCWLPPAAARASMSESGRRFPPTSALQMFTVRRQTLGWVSRPGLLALDLRDHPVAVEQDRRNHANALPPSVTRRGDDPSTHARAVPT